VAIALAASAMLAWSASDLEVDVRPAFVVLRTGQRLPSYVLVTGPRVENGHGALLCVACEHNG
jgi:hypothetical protein